MDLGDVTLAVQDSSGGAPTTIATLKYKDYNQSAYEKNGGILDIKFDPDPKKDLASKIKNGTLVVLGRARGIGQARERHWSKSRGRRRPTTVASI